MAANHSWWPPALSWPSPTINSSLSSRGTGVTDDGDEGDKFTAVPSLTSRRTSTLAQGRQQHDHRLSAMTTITFTSPASPQPPPSHQQQQTVAQQVEAAPSLIRRKSFTSLLLPLDPLAAESRSPTPANANARLSVLSAAPSSLAPSPSPSHIDHNRDSTAPLLPPPPPLASGLPASSYPILQLTPTLGITGPQAPQLLHELYRVRNSLARERRRNRSLLAGVVTLLIMGGTVYMIVNDGMAVWGLWKVRRERAGGVWGVGEGLNDTREIAARIMMGIRVAAFFGGWGVLAWLRTARRPHRVTLMALILAYFFVFLHVALSILNLVLTFLFSSPSAPSPSSLNTRCVPWAVDVVWGPFRTCLPSSPSSTSSHHKAWVTAASLRLGIVLLLGAIHLWLLHRFEQSLRVATIIDPTRAPTAEIRAMLARHEAEIVPLVPDGEGEEGEKGEKGLPNMPERKREWYVSEGGTVVEYPDESDSRPRSAPAQTGAGGGGGGFWGTIGWLFGLSSGGSSGAYHEVDVEKGDEDDHEGDVSHMLRREGGTSSGTGRVYAPEDMDNPPPPGWRTYERQQHIAMPTPMSIVSPRPQPQERPGSALGRYEFDDVLASERRGREEERGYRDLFRDVKSPPRRHSRDESEGFLTGWRRRNSRDSQDGNNGAEGMLSPSTSTTGRLFRLAGRSNSPAPPTKDSPPLPPPPPPPPPMNAQDRRYAYDFVSHDSFDTSTPPRHPAGAAEATDYNSAQYWQARRYSTGTLPKSDSYPLPLGGATGEEEEMLRHSEAEYDLADQSGSSSGTAVGRPRSHSQSHSRDAGAGAGSLGAPGEVVYVQMSNGQLVRKLSTIASEGSREEHSRWWTGDSRSANVSCASVPGGAGGTGGAESGGGRSLRLPGDGRWSE